MLLFMAVALAGCGETKAAASPLPVLPKPTASLAPDLDLGIVRIPDIRKAAPVASTSKPPVVKAPAVSTPDPMEDEDDEAEAPSAEPLQEPVVPTAEQTAASVALAVRKGTVAVKAIHKYALNLHRNRKRIPSLKKSPRRNPQQPASLLNHPLRLSQ